MSSLPLPADVVQVGQAAPLFGSLLVEVIAPDQTRLPPLPGWQLRAWPRARLGDLTVEARPLRAGGAAELCTALRAAGFTPLGWPLAREMS